MLFFRNKVETVAVAAFPKSGVTYLSSLLFYSLFPGEDPAEIERSFVVDVHGNRLKNAKPHNGHVFAKTHHPFGAHVKAHGRPAKVIYLVRDPLDIMNSAFDFHKLLDANYAVRREDFVDRWIATGGGDFAEYGAWVDHAASWFSQSVPIHLVTYASLVDMPEVEMDRLFSFLGFRPDAAAIKTAIENSSMKAMRSREENEYAERREGVYYRPFLEGTRHSGQRFINKGYRSSFDGLSPAQKLAASNKFGAVVERYLGTSYGAKV